MSGVWVFKNGVFRLIENPPAEPSDGRGNIRKKFLFHVPTDQVISSYGVLEEKLLEIGWERYYPRVNNNLLQFHKQDSLDLISLPRDFKKLTSVHMYDVVVKCRSTFEVRDVTVQPRT